MMRGLAKGHPLAPPPPKYAPSLDRCHHPFSYGMPVRDGARRRAPRAAARRWGTPRLAMRRGGAMAGESDWDGERACARGETERDGVGRGGR